MKQRYVCLILDNFTTLKTKPINPVIKKIYATSNDIASM